MSWLSSVTLSSLPDFPVYWGVFVELLRKAADALGKAISVCRPLESALGRAHGNVCSCYYRCCLGKLLGSQMLSCNLDVTL